MLTDIEKIKLDFGSSFESYLLKQINILYQKLEFYRNILLKQSDICYLNILCLKLILLVKFSYPIMNRSIYIFYKYFYYNCEIMFYKFFLSINKNKIKRHI